MKIAVIGAGFTGLSAAYELVKRGHEVALFEKEGSPGGLALGFKENKWAWSLEKHYHHWFSNDDSVLRLAKELNFETFTKRPKTSVFIENKIYQLDSPYHVLTFPKLNVVERLRMTTVLALLRYNPFWKPLEQIKAADFLPITMGENPYKKIWEPQLRNKFGDYMNEVSLAWFWARIRKRTAELAYPKGGFLKFANALVEKIEERNGRVLFNTEVIELKEKGSKINLVCLNDSNHFNYAFDKVIITLASFFFVKLAPQLPNDYKEKLMQLKGLGALNLVLRLKKPFLVDGTYWLSICDPNSPIMAIVEHTNFMDKKYYNNEHIVYIGNYLPFDHPHMKMTASELLKIYTPYLTKINPNFELCILNFELFKVPFAQPIIPVNYSKIMPSFETPLKNVYLANIQQVYPWDRGTNYAVELGEKIAKLITEQK